MKASCGRFSRRVLLVAAGLAVLPHLALGGISRSPVPLVRLEAEIGTLAYEGTAVIGQTLLLVESRRDTHVLWRMDAGAATPVSTTALATLPSVPAVDEPTPVGNLLFFVTGSAGDKFAPRTLWRTDLRPGGTFPLTVLGQHNTFMAAEDPIEVNGRLFLFTLHTPFEDSSGESTIDTTTLWTSDGTVEGTRALVEWQRFRVEDGPHTGVCCPRDLMNLGGMLYFTLEDIVIVDDLERHETVPYVSDGSAVFPFDLQVPRGRPYPQHPIVFRDRLLFSVFVEIGKAELWSTDHTASDLSLLGLLPSSPLESVATHDAVFLRVLDSDDAQIWRTNGTAEGTMQVASFERDGSPDLLTAVDRSLFFRVKEPDGTAMLWTSDGTPPGTRRLGVLETEPIQRLAVDGALFFTAEEQGGIAFWRSDGATAPTRVAGFAPKSCLFYPSCSFFSSEPCCSFVNRVTPFDGGLFFDGAASGLEPGLWAVLASCGDGSLNAGEVCDDGNLVDGDGCDTRCRCSSDAICADDDHCTRDHCREGVCLHEAIVCGDQDRCTDDGCEPRRGCTNTERLATEPAGVTCRVDNMQVILREPPQPVCLRRCPTTLAKHLDKVAQLIDAAVMAPKKIKCMRKLRAARRIASRLRRRVAQLAKKGNIVPLERGQRLRSAAKRLAQGTKALAKGNFCSRPGSAVGELLDEREG